MVSYSPLKCPEPAESLYTCISNFQDPVKMDPSTYSERPKPLLVLVKSNLDKLSGDEDRHFWAVLLSFQETWIYVKGTIVVLIVLSFDLNGIGPSGVTRGLICSIRTQIYREEKVHGDAIPFVRLPQQSLGWCEQWYSPLPIQFGAASAFNTYLKISKHQKQNTYADTPQH